MKWLNMLDMRNQCMIDIRDRTLISRTSRPTLVAAQPSIWWTPKVFPTRLKQTGHDDSQVLLSNAEVKNMCPWQDGSQYTDYASDWMIWSSVPSVGKKFFRFHLWGRNSAKNVWNNGGTRNSWFGMTKQTGADCFVSAKMLAAKNIAMIPYPPYSPDFAPWDFVLFLRMKSQLQDTISKMSLKFRNNHHLSHMIPKTQFQQCFWQWQKHWTCCINSLEH